MNTNSTKVASDISGYLGTRWGMTHAEICKVFGKDLCRLSEREDFKGFYADHFLPSVEIGEINFEAIFQVSSKTDGLAQVLLRKNADSRDPEVANYQTVQAVLTRQYGPARISTVESPDNPETQWVFPTTTIGLRLLYVPSVLSLLTISYQPTERS